MNQFLPVFNVELETIGLDCVAGVFVGLVAAIAPTWRAATIKIADGLRRIG
jgi:putative ABC transport system permease protein